MCGYEGRFRENSSASEALCALTSLKTTEDVASFFGAERLEMLETFLTEESNKANELLQSKRNDVLHRLKEATGKL